jgi:hypothetical protein
MFGSHWFGRTELAELVVGGAGVADEESDDGAAAPLSAGAGLLSPP